MSKFHDASRGMAEKINSVIPNTNNIVDQLKSIITSISELNSVIVASQIQDKSIVRNIEQTLSNLTESLLIISTFSHQINGLLRSLDGGDNLRSLSMALAVNPVSTVKRLFSKEIEQKPEDLLGTYVKIINIMLFIQDNANQISPRKTARAIKKLMNALFLVSNTLSFVNNKIQKLPRIESLEAIDSIWNILGSNQKLIADFVENSKVITNLKLHRSISNLVNSYVHLISGAIDIGNILVTGEAPVYILGIRTPRKRKVGTLKEIAVGVASLYAFSKLFNEILKIITPLFENLQKIHEVGRVASYNAVKTIVMAYSNIVSALIDLYNIFHNGTLPNYAVGVKAGTKQITEDGQPPMVLILKAASYASIMGVVFSIFTTTAVPIFKNLDKINKVGKVKSYIGLHSLFYVLKFMYDRIKSDNWTNIDALQMMNAIMYASFINVFLTLSFPAVMLLAQFGKNRRGVRRGLRVLDTIFNGRQGFLKVKTPSLTNIINGISSLDIKIFISSLKTIGLMALFVLATLPIITSLTFMGYNFIVIRLGLMALNYTIFKILNILDKLMIRMDKLDIMKAVVVLGKLLLITSILTLISLEVTMIGAAAPFIILASLSMIPLYFCVMMMISILKYASKRRSVVVKGSLVLDLMTEAFAGLMELIGSLVGAMMGIEITGTISAISSLILILGLLILMPMALSLVKTQVSIGLFSMIALCVGIILFAGMIVLISSIVEGVKFSTIAIFVGQVILIVAAFTALGFASQFLIPLLTPLLIVAVEIFTVVALLAKVIDIAQKTNTEGASQSLCNVIDAFTDPISKLAGLPIDKLLLAEASSRKLRKIARNLAKMAFDISNIANLNIATKWNKDGDPIEFKAMNKDMFKLATENSLEIVKTIINAVVGVDGEAGLDLDAISKKSVKKFRQIKRISNQLAKMASNVASIASLKYATKWDEEGNPIEYAQMTEQMFLDATTNAMAIIRTVATTLSNKEITEFLNKEFDNGKENIRMIGEMGNAVGGMVQGIISLKEGKIAEYDLKTGEVIGYKTVSDLINDEKARTELGTNLQQLLGIYVEAVTNDKIWDAAKGDTWFTSSKIEAAEKLFERLNTNIIPGTNSIISGIVELQKNKDLQNLTEKVGGNQTKADLMKANLSALLGTYVDTVANIDTSKIDDTKISSLNKIGNLIDKFNKPIESSTVEGQKKILENISKFIDKANTVNTDKIKSTADMFMQMAKISESIRGNFDGLAEALNDNLMEVLEELRDILKETNGIIDTNKATSTSNNQTSVSQMYQHQLVQPSTSQDTQKPVDMTPVIEKLEGLLQAFKGGVPVYNKVGTRLQINTSI